MSPIIPFLINLHIPAARNLSHVLSDEQVTSTMDMTQLNSISKVHFLAHCPLQYCLTHLGLFLLYLLLGLV